MNPSNRHPKTAARGLRRAFLLQAACGLLTMLLAAPAPAFAQNVIQFTLGVGTARYKVLDNGMGLQSFPFPQDPQSRINSSTRSDYPGGRQYLYGSVDVTVWSESTGQSKAVTNFQGALPVVLGSTLWSNDGLDSFVSFNVYNSTTRQSYTYRAHVSATDIASASFQPVTLGDPRLELVKDWQSVGETPFYWWNHDGSRFYYPDPRDKTKVRVKTVGVGVTVDDDPVALVAPAELTELRVIPPVYPLNPVSDRYLVATAFPIGTGILAMDLQTSTWWWLATQPTSSISGIRGPCFSPDGSMIAFGNTRYDSKKTPYYGVYAVPFFGGPITRVTEVMGSKNTSLFVTVNNWDTP